MADEHGRSPRFETVAVGHGEAADASAPVEQRGDGEAAGTGAARDLTVPIHLSSTFAVDGIDPETTLEDLDPDAGEYLYSRLANPTRRALERRVAALEGASHGMAFASGTAAVSGTIAAVVEPGAHVIASEHLYGGTRTMLDGLFEERFGVEVSYVDARDPDAVAAAVRPGTALVWVESPTNPLLTLCDLRAVAEAVGERAVLGVDNTFASPYFQRPLELGADVVVHSATKYLNGHSDSVGGAAVTDDDALAEAIRFNQQMALGSMLAPFDAYQVLRGIKTLPVRMRQHAENATAVAEFLADRELVEAVHYPGLASHPQHELAAGQMSGFGGMVSAELATDLGGVQRFVAALETFTLAVSLGGVESLVEHPASMTHSGVPAAEREAQGITGSLLRFSVGIEHPADLLADLEAGLAAVRDYEGA